MESDVLCFRSTLFSASLHNLNRIFASGGQQVAPFFLFLFSVGFQL